MVRLFCALSPIVWEHANANRAFSIYILFRKNTAFLGAVFAGAFAFEVAYDNGMDKVWDKINKGRQWKDIRHKYVEAEE
ncbi:ubiquinol-cytochrome C reductase [Sordaria brevicollis]|uniref:Complex III subunit 9 n=1 Tax=Sordaria brevicollis TaxID=83679 RepID=A0AAE0PDP9_SORBR|nr:ubiquinol-cytochrome C reductase [Sordaria brevicollis]